MNDEILNENNEEIDAKELLNRRKEQQFKLNEQLFKTDEKEKEKAIERRKEEEELEKAIKPYVSVRKVIIGLCFLMWAFAVVCLITGALEMRMFLPMCLIVLCALSGINAPIFFIKKQIKDMIVAVLGAAICFFTAVIIFTLG